MSKKLLSVLLDGRRIKYPVNYNVEEGWVEFEIPRIHKEPTLIESGKSIEFNNSNEEHEITWESKKQFGKVELIYSK